MKRLTILTLGVLAFVLLCCSSADAGPLRKFLDRFRRDRPAVERRTETPRRHATDNRLPSGGCAGGVCPSR